MKNNKFWYILSTFSQIGFIIAVPVAVLAYFGHKLDVKVGTSPLFLLLGMTFSLFISFMAIYRMIKKLDDK